MADEIRALMQVRLNKGAMSHSYTPSQFAVDQSGAIVYDVTHSVGTTEETAGPSFGDIGTEGTFVVHNLDSTNYVQVGFSTGVYGVRLKPDGLPLVGNLEPNATIYLKANTAACNVRIIVYEA